MPEVASSFHHREYTVMKLLAMTGTVNGSCGAERRMQHHLGRHCEERCPAYPRGSVTKQPRNCEVQWGDRHPTHE